MDEIDALQLIINYLDKVFNSDLNWSSVFSLSEMALKFLKGLHLPTCTLVICKETMCLEIWVFIVF